MFNLLSIVQLILGFLLTALVLLQRANTDASGAFGADGGSNGTLEKRGAEKSLHQLTIIVVVLFFLSLAANILVR